VITDTKIYYCFNCINIQYSNPKTTKYEQ